MSEDTAGIFVGLESSSYEYIAYLIAPYRPDFQIEIGNLLLIKGTNEDIVSRVMDYFPRGEFMTEMGERWLNEITSKGAIDAVGQDIKRSKISYRVRIKVLGAIRGERFFPGLRRIPQIASKVKLPDRNEFEKIINNIVEGDRSDVYIGNHALNRDIQIHFDQKNLNSKRTFIFARAGYGKSNLMKIICSGWKSDNGGLMVFDPEGEYAVTDKNQRPGIMDARPTILFTNQKMNDDLCNVYRDIRIDLRKIQGKMMIPILVTPEKHDTVFFNKLMGMTSRDWPRLVELLYEKGWNTPQGEVERILHKKLNDDPSSKSVVTQAIINNLVPAIQRLYKPNSNTIDIITKALRRGDVIIFDISRIDSQTARDVSSIIIKCIFEENKNNFIKYGGNNLIRATFVLEEAHTVLAEPSKGSPSTFIELAKEGRKYSLGGIFITQQPGSIQHEIISQGDNFFIFHLLSKGDLRSLSDANAHYSEDIITQILNEPIRGKSYMWTSHQPFVIPIMVRNFEALEYVQPHKSIVLQQENRILEEIVNEIARERDDPRIESIRNKLLEIEELGGDMKENAVRLYTLLSIEEKKYLKGKNGIRVGNDGTDFAVTYVCYRNLRDSGNI